jgi:RNA polymerase sigma-70 factor (ECF subfamily)
MSLASGDMGSRASRHAAAASVGVLLRVTSDSGDAEDALQETFVRAWRGISKFERRSSFFTWLYRIGLNEAKRRLERRPPPQVLTGDGEALLDHIGDRRPLPDARAEQRELLVALAEAVRQLEPEYRVPLVLRDIEGFSTREAATMMELSVPAFKSRLHRARMSVRGALERLLESEDGSA